MRLLDHDSFTGVTEHFHKDAMTGKVTVKQSQDVQSVIDSNRVKRIENRSWKGDLHHVASIPVIVVEMWRNELIQQGVSNPDPLAKENHKFLIAKINSGDWSKLRTKEGRI